MFLEQALWGLVRLWLDAAYGSVRRCGSCHDVVYAASQIEGVLVHAYLMRPLSPQEQKMIKDALQMAGYPGVSR